MKKEKKETKVNEKQVSDNIEKLEKEMINKKKLPEEEMKKINKKVFENILIADIVLAFFYFISLGSFNIESGVFLTDLKVFSIGFIALTILLFEMSYKKDNGNLCIHGIECFILAIFMLFSTYLYVVYMKNFALIVASVSYLFGIYFVGKSIILYFKMRKQYVASLNDIGEIIKK